MRHVEWSIAAESTWKKLPVGDATLVARAAVRFAETGEGDFEVIDRGSRPTVRLRASLLLCPRTSRTSVKLITQESRSPMPGRVSGERQRQEVAEWKAIPLPADAYAER